MLSSTRFLIIAFLSLSIHFTPLSGQESKELFLAIISNTAESDPRESALNQYLEYVKSLPKKNTWLFGLGDYTDQNGISKNPGNDNQQRLDFLNQLDKEVHRSLIIGGDRDWDRSGIEGLKKYKNLEDYLDEILGKKTIFIKNGCPGPKVIELNDQYVCIAINSQWFIHPHEKPQFPNTDCDISSAYDFWEELEDALEDNENKRIIILTHHPIYSSGKSFGNQMGSLHLLPIVGSFINSYRKNIGLPSDFAHPNHQAYSLRMREIIADFSNILFISGHEHNTEIIRKGNNYFLNAGGMIKNDGSDQTSDHLFSTNEPLSLSLRLKSDKSIDLLTSNDAFQIPLSIEWIERENPPLALEFSNTRSDSSTAVAGKEYKAGGFHRFWMGDHYRDEWITPVKAPNLYLDTMYGGLIPYARGGGLQTNSLKFKAADGRRFSFRSINKNPERALTREVKQTVYKHLVKDLITTQHPYGGLVASHLLDQTDILHARPMLFYLPPQQELGQYNRDFGDGFGTLELRPSDKSDPPFGQADDIVSSHQMFYALHKYDDHVVDKHAYAKARVFDMWMGDWDRHEDNWKWAVYKEGKKTVYRPIPRDRDHVFSQWEGIIPSVADAIIPNAEHFDYDYKNLKHLNWKARHLDRMLGNELTAQDWENAAEYLQSIMDSTVIAAALNQFPPEIESISGTEIEEKLKTRLITLKEAAHNNYLLLAGEVDVTGSNKKEKFTISEKDEGIEVHVTDKKKTIYRRVFFPSETKAINLYGLEGNDDFTINLAKASPIKIRIISGKGKDEIQDLHPGMNKNIYIYDKYLKDEIIGGQGLTNVKSFQDPTYNDKWFEYPAFFPFVGLKNSSGNGFGIQGSFTYSTIGFNKPGFAHQLSGEAIYYPALKAHHVDARHKYRHVLGNWDSESSVTVSAFYSKFPFFYGLGNESIRDDELAEDNFYRIDYNTVKFNTGLSKTFWRKSFVKIYGLYEYNNIQEAEGEAQFFKTTPQYSDRGRQHVGGAGIDLDINFKDNDLFTTQGSQLLASWRSHFSSFGNFTKLSGQLSHYQSYQLITRTTFIVKAGGATVIGDAPFYQLSTLGSNSNLRGHVRNRFVDRSSIYYNTEIRMQLGTWRTVIAPIKYGIFFLHDSGKVFSGNLNFDGTFNSTYGGGIYFAPLSEAYSLVLTVARSADRENYARLDFGWRL